MDELKKIWDEVDIVRRRIWIVATLILLAVTVSSYFLADDISNKNTANKQQVKSISKKDELDAFVKEIVSKQLKVDYQPKPKIKNKIFIYTDDLFDNKKYLVDGLGDKIPKLDLARNKNELETIIDIKQLITGGSVGIEHKYPITIIDVSQRKIIAAKEFRLVEKTAWKSKRNDSFNLDTYDQIIKYIKSLPIEN